MACSTMKLSGEAVKYWHKLLMNVLYPSISMVCSTMKLSGEAVKYWHKQLMYSKSIYLYGLQHNEAEWRSCHILAQTVHVLYLFIYLYGLQHTEAEWRSCQILAQTAHEGSFQHEYSLLCVSQ
jgi:CRISPR/Cas system-associated protein Cas7 (RAMP superfamily)